MEENLSLDLSSDVIEGTIIEKPAKSRGKKEISKTSEEIHTSGDTPEYVSCLRNERVIVRFIKKGSKLISDPKHVLFGGMAENATKRLTVPLLRNGALKNILTNEEKTFLEHIMGLPYNALSIYTKVDNYWTNYFVRLTKDDAYLDLSNPEDYIKYKVLLANDELVAPSLKELEKRPKESYKFVLVSEKDEANVDNTHMETAMEANSLFAEISDDLYSLRVILELMEGKPTASTVKLSFVKPQVYKRLVENPKLFVSIVGDKYFKTKVFIKRCVEKGVITKRGEYHYRSSDSFPLAPTGYEPTLDVAAMFLNTPTQQTIKFSLEAMLKSKE